MATSLLALLDDIATVLDDVSIAAKKTAGVLGDDLALNAQQVVGVQPDRELPVVWAVAKGSLLNKAILIPAALVISAFLPQAVTPLLMLGGAFLCFEGAEKVLHKLAPTRDDETHAEALHAAAANPAVDLVAFEREKIKGAVRTDFILSAEILVISLGVVAERPFASQAAVLSAIAVAMTVGVYGLVAGIVKLDDAGLRLSRGASAGARGLGRAILAFAPRFMTALGILGTVAMFLVGGGILVHGIGPIHHAIEGLLAGQTGWIATLGGTVAEGLVGLVAGLVCVALVKLGGAVLRRRPKD